MNKEALSHKVEVVDGQELLVPDEEGWRQLHDDPVLDGIEVGIFLLPAKLREDRQLTQNYPGFLLALYTPSRRKDGWLPIMLLKTAGDWQRVHIERLTCDVCGWQGNTANPTLSDLYDGVPERKAIFERAWHHPVVPCPRCGGKLPRHPIWVEPLVG